MGRNRFIPAPAGNALCACLCQGLSPVHPRACGERSLSGSACSSSNGSSPRLRGTLFWESDNADSLRFIPAPAGNATTASICRKWVPVHPRACGERVVGMINYYPQFGSSPRLRGTQRPHQTAIPRYRFIPAPAGNARPSNDTCRAPTVHPRACGERQGYTYHANTPTGSSPRLRGTLPARVP